MFSEAAIICKLPCSGSSHFKINERCSKSKYAANLVRSEAANWLKTCDRESDLVTNVLLEAPTISDDDEDHQRWKLRFGKY